MSERPAWADSVKGEERHGPLLSLDEEHAPMRRGLMDAAKRLCVEGGVKRQPEIGDLVVMTDVLFPMGHPHDDWWRGFGILLAVEAGVGGEAWYLEYGNDPGDIARWTNCDPVAVPV